MFYDEDADALLQVNDAMYDADENDGDDNVDASSPLQISRLGCSLPIPSPLFGCFRRFACSRRVLFFRLHQ